MIKNESGKKSMTQNARESIDDANITWVASQGEHTRKSVSAFMSLKEGYLVSRGKSTDEMAVVSNGFGNAQKYCGSYNERVYLSLGKLQSGDRLGDLTKRVFCDVYSDVYGDVDPLFRQNDHKYKERE
jgi:hypothetical protein